MFRLSELALRIPAGAYILNSGIGKQKLDKDSAEGMQQMAQHAIPQLGAMEPEQFGKLLSWGEIGLGAALLMPFVPSRLVGLGLTAFGGALFRMYMKTPGFTEADGIRPSSHGVPFAKDVWLVGMGLALILMPRRRG